MKARTMAVGRGERRVSGNKPKVWFTSTEAFAKLLSAGNRELLRVIAEKAPGSLDELARITGKAKSNLSRTLRTMKATAWSASNAARPHHTQGAARPGGTRPASRAAASGVKPRSAFAVLFRYEGEVKRAARNSSSKAEFCGNVRAFV